MNALYPLLATVAAYLIGSLSFAVIVSRAMGLNDPRTYGSGNPVTMEAYEVTKPWAEDSATWMDAAAGMPWEMPGAMGPSDHAARFSDRVSFGGGGRWVWFDVTSLARMWVMDPNSNNGIVIMGSGATNSELEFTASEYVVPFARPQLKLIYQAP